MDKLYFKYGAMGCGKTANALMTKFNYEQQGQKVLLLKSVIDDRNIKDGEVVVHTRIGLESKCVAFGPNQNLITLFKKLSKTQKYDVIIVDEAQFATAKQVDQLKELSCNIPVLCYGLLTNFQTKLFEGSKRLVEVAESLQEIKSVCACGRKANVNVRFVDGKLTTRGRNVAIEKGNVTYRPMCHKCFLELKKSQKSE